MSENSYDPVLSSTEPFKIERKSDKKLNALSKIVASSKV